MSTGSSVSRPRRQSRGYGQHKPKRCNRDVPLKDFQTARGIAVDGVVGKLTWINIDEADQTEPVLKNGSEGLPVRRLQNRLTLAGFDTGGVDTGSSGTSTEAAVKTLQQQSSLTVHGVVGPATRAVVDAFDR